MIIAFPGIIADIYSIQKNAAFRRLVKAQQQPVTQPASVSPPARIVAAVLIESAIRTLVTMFHLKNFIGVIVSLPPGIFFPESARII